MVYIETNQTIPVRIQWHQVADQEGTSIHTRTFRRRMRRAPYYPLEDNRLLNHNHKSGEDGTCQYTPAANQKTFF